MITEHSLLVRHNYGYWAEKRMASPPLWFHVVHHQKLCWQVTHTHPYKKLSKHLGAWKCTYIAECISLIKLPSDGVVMLNWKCQVHIGSDASFWVQEMIAHIHTAGRYVKGLEMETLQGLHWDTVIAIISTVRLSSGNVLRSHFQTGLNDHRTWNVISYYLMCL